jgi:hypothetical protein
MERARTIENLILENKNYIVEYKLNDKYHLFIEALNEFGESIQDDTFNEQNLTQNILVELHETGFDQIAEWYGICSFELYTTLEYLERVMHYAIEQFEQEQ